MAQGRDPAEQFPRVSAVGPDEPQSQEGVSNPRENKPCPVAILNAGWMDDGDEHKPDGIYEQMALAAVDLLARVIAMRPPLSVVLTD